MEVGLACTSIAVIIQLLLLNRAPPGNSTGPFQPMDDVPGEIGELVDRLAEFFAHVAARLSVADMFSTLQTAERGRGSLSQLLAAVAV